MVVKQGSPEAQADSKENKPLPQRLLEQSGLQTQRSEGRASAENKGRER